MLFSCLFIFFIMFYVMIAIGFFLVLCLFGICDDHFRLICSCFTLPLYSLFWMGFLFWIAFIYLPHLRIFPFHTLPPWNPAHPILSTAVIHCCAVLCSYVFLSVFDLISVRIELWMNFFLTSITWITAKARARKQRANKTLKVGKCKNDCE